MRTGIPASHVQLHRAIKSGGFSRRPGRSSRRSPTYGGTAWTACMIGLRSTSRRCAATAAEFASTCYICKPNQSEETCIIVHGVSIAQGAPLNESDHCGDPPLLLAAGNGVLRLSHTDEHRLLQATLRPRSWSFASHLQPFRCRAPDVRGGATQRRRGHRAAQCGAPPRPCTPTIAHV